MGTSVRVDRRDLARRIVQRVHQQLVDDVRDAMGHRPARSERLGPRADLAHRDALLHVVGDHALADPRVGRDVLLEPEQIAGDQLLGRDAEVAVVRVADEVADRGLEHEGDEAIVVEIVADHDDRNADRAESVAGGQPDRAVDDDERDVAELGGNRVVVVDGNPGGGERAVDHATDVAVTAHANRTWTRGAHP